MITSSTPNNWKQLQDEVALILKECGFTVEVEKIIQTARGEVEVDVYAEENVRGRKYSIACECKYWKSRVPQSVIHSFRSVVSDIGVNLGYIVSTCGFQRGSFKASELTNLKLLTWEEFQTEFEESWYEEFFVPTLTERLDPLLTYTELLLPKWFDMLPKSEKEKFINLKENYDHFGWLIMSFSTYVRMLEKDKKMQKLPLVNRIPEKYHHLVPPAILAESGYREFLSIAISFGDEIIKKFRDIRDRNLKESED